MLNILKMYVHFIYLLYLHFRIKPIMVFSFHCLLGGSEAYASSSSLSSSPKDAMSSVISINSLVLINFDTQISGPDVLYLIIFDGP